LKVFFLVVFVLSGTYFSYANDPIKISILTCSPGNESHSIFGHSAIRITNSETSFDAVYNFGLFDFDTSFFAIRFLNGRLKYELGVQDTKSFIREYTKENRAVTEQVLDLTLIEKKQFIGLLKNQYKPENRYYIYSFLRKNCSTEIRDILFKNNTSLINKNFDQTARSLLNTYFNDHKWVGFGINVLLGSPVDRKINVSQSMFLPDYFYKGISDIYIGQRKLVKEEISLNTTSPKKARVNWFTPLTFFTSLLLILIFWAPTQIQSLLFLLVGIIGILLIFFWLFSNHIEMKNNFNILWCNPLYLFYIFNKKQKRNKKLIVLLSISLILPPLLWFFKIQVFDLAILPIICILGLFNFKLFKIAKAS